MLERCTLMGKAVEHRPVRCRQYIGQCIGRTQAVPKRKRIDEVPDEVLESVLGASTDRGSDHDVGAGTEQRCGDRGRGVHEGEHADTVRFCGTADPGSHVGVEDERHVTALVCRMRAPRAVGSDDGFVGCVGEG